MSDDPSSRLYMTKFRLAGHMLQRSTSGSCHARDHGPGGKPEFFASDRSAERGETIVVTKNGRPVAKITPQSGDRTNDPEWRANFAALKKSLRSKRGSGLRVGTITEDDKYGDDTG